MLREILGRRVPGLVPPDLLVGTETADDAAVYRIGEGEAIVATTDFFTPIVDDPVDFGAISAANALSDVYAMGGTPLFALAVAGMPVGRLPVDTIRRILEGGEATCAKAGIPVAGGHTIDSIEPIYGLVAIGRVDPRRIKRNKGAQSGDALVLGKPLGVGVYSAALRKQRLAPEDYAAMLFTTTQLNTPGAILGGIDDVHALTDVTGFGLVGHLLEMCRASDIGAQIRFDRVPLLGAALTLAREGFVTGASARNWAGSENELDVDRDIDEAERALLADPQTSGGLLVACAPGATRRVLDVFAEQGFREAAVIGEFTAGPARIAILARSRESARAAQP